MLSWLYGKIIDLRNDFYERGFFRSASLGAKTLSVGNITVGGTGKTPLVAFVAEILAARGEKVCVLSRGYGRAEPKKRVLVSDGEKVLADARSGGDEPFELAKKLLGKAFVVADADRVSAAKWAREKFGITAFVLDDAFQHRRARRDLDLVVVDATNPFGSGQTLPFGKLRESLKNLRRADLIVISRANFAAGIEDLKTEIRQFNADCPIFACENIITKLTELENFTAKRENEKRNLSFNGEKALAFCALGNPENFFAQMRRENYDLAGTLTFRDHHFYAAQDIEKIEREAASSNAEMLLTTAKDAAKLINFKFDRPCFVVEIGLRFKDEEKFRQMIANL